MGAAKYRWKAYAGMTDADEVLHDIRDLLFILACQAAKDPRTSKMVRDFEQKRREVIPGDGH